MQRRLKVIRQLVLESSYVVDPDLVASAIVERARIRRLVPDTRFRNDLVPVENGGAGRAMSARTEVRSFRPAPVNRSFRLTARRRSRDANHRVATPARA